MCHNPLHVYKSLPPVLVQQTHYVDLQEIAFTLTLSD